MTEMGELSVEDQLRRERDWAREERDLLAAELASTGVGEYIVANQQLAKQIHTLEDERDEAINLLADTVVKATEYGTQDGDFVANYILPTGPIHRAIPWLEQRRIVVRPGFDGRKSKEEQP